MIMHKWEWDSHKAQHLVVFLESNEASVTDGRLENCRRVRADK